MAYRVCLQCGDRKRMPAGVDVCRACLLLDAPLAPPPLRVTRDFLKLVRHANRMAKPGPPTAAGLSRVLLPQAAWERIVQLCEEGKP